MCKMVSRTDFPEPYQLPDDATARRLVRQALIRPETRILRQLAVVLAAGHGPIDLMQMPPEEFEALATRTLAAAAPDRRPVLAWAFERLGVARQRRGAGGNDPEGSEGNPKRVHARFRGPKCPGGSTTRPGGVVMSRNIAAPVGMGTRFGHVRSCREPAAEGCWQPRTRLAIPACETRR